MHFSNPNSIHVDPDLKLYGTSMPVVAETKFLGSDFGRKLTFAAHIKYVKDRCLKALNLLHVCSALGLGCRQCNITQDLSIAQHIKAGFWLCGVRVSTTIGSGES